MSNSEEYIKAIEFIKMLGLDLSEPDEESDTPTCIACEQPHEYTCEYCDDRVCEEHVVVLEEPEVGATTYLCIDCAERRMRR